MEFGGVQFFFSFSLWRSLKSEKEKHASPLSICFLCVSSQLQKRKEREEQLEDVIQAYEKIHMEKSNLQRDLDKMVRDARCRVYGSLNRRSIIET